MKSMLLRVLLSCCGGMMPLAAQAAGPNPDYAPGDLVMFFQEEGGTKTVYVKLGQTALDFRGTAAGADAPNIINIVNANDALVEAFGSDWSTKTKVYAGLAGVWGTSGNLSNSLENGDPNRTLYVSKARSAVGSVGSTTQLSPVIGSDGSMTTAATAINLMNNNPFETLYSGAVVVSPNGESSIDDNNPFLSAGLQGTAFGVFAGGVQQAGQSGNFGSFGPVANVEFMLDLYRILAKTGISGQVGGTLRQGSYEGTIVLDSDGMISFVTTAGGGGTTTYTLTTSATTNGSISGGGTFNAGDSATLTATPAAGYVFTGWTGDASGTTNPLSVTMDGNKTIGATFSAQTYTLTTSATSNGSISGGGTFNAGDNATLTATPAAGYVFTGWTGDASGTTNPLSVTMDGNKTIGATFSAQTYTLTTSATSNGSISGGGTFNSGDSATLTATPAAGYVFTGWTGDASGTTNPLSVTMDGNKTIGATFNRNAADSDGDGFTDYEETRMIFPGGIRIADTYALDLSVLDVPSDAVIAVSGLPAGLSYNALSRSITGQVTGKAGTYNVVIRVTKGKVVLSTKRFALVVGDFPKALAARYEMLLNTTDSNGNTPLGVLRISVAAGIWTGSFDYPGQARASGRGTFALVPGQAKANLDMLIPATKSAVGVRVQCEIGSTSDIVAGSFTILNANNVPGGSTGGINGFRLSKAGQNPDANRKITIVMQPTVPGDGVAAPGGIGWATGTINTAGGVNVLGELGDGQKFSASLALSATRETLLWSQPYKNKNSYAAGMLQFGNLDLATRYPVTAQASPVQGALLWKRVADATELSYQAGFVQRITGRTSAWFTMPDGEMLGLALGLGTSNECAATYTAWTGVASAPTTIGVLDNLKLEARAPAIPAAFAGTANGKIGSFGGAIITQPAAGTVKARTANVSGVFLQDDVHGVDVGAGLIKIPENPALPAGRYRTAGIQLSQPAGPVVD